MCFASPWSGKDAPLDDGQWMKHRRSLQNLEEISEPTWGETLMDVAASVMAMAELGVAKGFWTEKEFIRTKLRALSFLEQDRKKMQDQLLLHDVRALRTQLHITLEAVRNWCLQTWRGQPGEELVEIMRVQVGSSPLNRSNPGTVLVRIVSANFAKTPQSLEERETAIHDYVLNYTESLPNFFETHLRVVAITPEEQVRSPKSLEFDNYIQDLDMEEDAGVYQRRITGFPGEGEGDDDGGDSEPESPVDSGVPGIRV